MLLQKKQEASLHFYSAAEYKTEANSWKEARAEAMQAASQRSDKARKPKPVPTELKVYFLDNSRCFVAKMLLDGGVTIYAPCVNPVDETPAEMKKAEAFAWLLLYRTREELFMCKDGSKEEIEKAKQHALESVPKTFTLGPALPTAYPPN
mmetsp:Transcript_21149/g.38601  ORF Transcript_21149/g.38601 Transcript_21149/m.38601 type:complete len:150 (-) Transcript_21149:83-532(-)